jgi:hypothetical protein
MNFIIRLYVWGVIAELLLQLYARIMYLFGFKERKTYQANLNKVGLSWDPLYLRVYPASEFTHSSLRFWKIAFLDLLGSLLSWYQVLYRINNIRNVYKLTSVLTPEQKEAAFVLRNDSTLSKNELIEKLRILDPSLIVREPGTMVISKEVDSKDFARLLSKVALDEKAHEVFFSLVEANGWVVTSREMAMLKCVVGELGRDSLLHFVNERRNSDVDFQKAEIVNRQIRILQGMFAKENVE